MAINAQANALRNQAMAMIAGKKPAKAVNAAIAKANTAIAAANKQNLAQSYASVGKKALQHPPMDQVHIGNHK